MSSINGSSLNGSVNAAPSSSEVATFANGCFWGPSHMFKKHFKGKGYISDTVGYVGGKMPNPTYREVCSGKTGHAEACQLTFDPTQVSYEQLVEFFYRSHDPTQRNRQGNDVGTQYRSLIATHSDEQDRIAREVTDRIQKERFEPRGGQIVTEIVSLKDNPYYVAEDYHQDYLENNPFGYHCPTHRKRFNHQNSPLEPKHCHCRQVYTGDQDGSCQ